MAVLLLRHVAARRNAVIWAHPDSSTRGERLEIFNGFDLLRHTLGCGRFGDHQVGHCSQDRALPHSRNKSFQHRVNQPVHRAAPQRASSSSDQAVLA